MLKLDYNDWKWKCYKIINVENCQNFWKYDSYYTYHLLKVITRHWKSKVVIAFQLGLDPCPCQARWFRTIDRVQAIQHRKTRKDILEKTFRVEVRNYMCNSTQISEKPLVSHVWGRNQAVQLKLNELTRDFFCHQVQERHKFNYHHCLIKQIPLLFRNRILNFPKYHNIPETVQISRLRNKKENVRKRTDSEMTKMLK